MRYHARRHDIGNSSTDLAWVNRTVFVATAERHAASVVYDLFALR